jgi:Tfp pilus assembly protein PilV
MVCTRGSRGVSLAEVVITITLLGFIFMILFNLYPSTIATMRHAEHIIEATSFAQSILEKKRAEAFSAFDTAPSPLETLNGSDGTTYTPTFSPIAVPSPQSDNLKGARVTVTWLERKKTCSVTKELYVCNMPK